MDKLKSRKLWLALLGALLPIIAQGLTGEVGWNETVMASAAIIMSYIFGQGYVDGKALEGNVASVDVREA
jgi:hypothetical protein